MVRAEVLQGVREMCFEALLDRHERGELSQAEAAEMLGISERTFRRRRDRLRDKDPVGPVDRRIAAGFAFLGFPPVRHFLELADRITVAQGAQRRDPRVEPPESGRCPLISTKERGLWTTSGDRTPWLKEGGRGTVPIACHFQLRPNPLAD